MNSLFRNILISGILVKNKTTQKCGEHDDRRKFNFHARNLDIILNLCRKNSNIPIHITVRVKCYIFMDRWSIISESICRWSMKDICSYSKIILCKFVFCIFIKSDKSVFVASLSFLFQFMILISWQSLVFSKRKWYEVSIAF